MLLTCYVNLIIVHMMYSAVCSNLIAPQCIVLRCGLTVPASITSIRKLKIAYNNGLRGY